MPPKWQFVQMHKEIMLPKWQYDNMEYNIRENASKMTICKRKCFKNDNVYKWK